MRAFSRALMRLRRAAASSNPGWHAKSPGRAQAHARRKPRSLRVCRIVLDPHTYALFVRDDGALPETEGAETAFAVDDEVDLSVHIKVR